MTLAGLSISSACPPTLLTRNGVGGTVEIPCSATLENATGVDLLVTAVSVYPDGRLAVEARGWTLLPGQSVEIPAPPQGATWVVLTESTGRAEAATWLDVGALVLVGGLAGLGLADVILAIGRGVRRRAHR